MARQQAAFGNQKQVGSCVGFSGGPLFIPNGWNSAIGVSLVSSQVVGQDLPHDFERRLGKEH
jgi:hypothetical protein